MKNIRKNIRYIQFFLLFLAVALTACTRQITTPLPTNPVVTLLTPTPQPIPTEEPNPALFLAQPLPVGIVNPSTLSGVDLSNDPASALWFGLSNNSPEGEVITASDWTYALAAPFPTPTDNIALSDLQSYWKGQPNAIMATVATLYLPEAVAEHWRMQWGAMESSAIIVSDEALDPDLVWEENAWVVLPFDVLSPKLKVITIDDVSPLAKDFDPAGYSLSLTYALVWTGETVYPLSEAQQQTLSNAITPTNRDATKMTTLVMTGVTALVRATAYKMELNGILYPGEKIVDWLSEADLTHISNEVSFYEDCPFPDPNSRLLFFCSNPDYIELFEFIGADIIELTGNHNNDSAYVYGVDVVPSSIDMYEERGMIYFGGGRDLADALQPALVTHNGNRLAFIGCNASGPNFAWATPEHGGSAPCGDYTWMVNEINRLRSEGYLPIATFQYYEDYYNFAEEHHVRDFGLMADAGAVIVNGSQAHRPKGMAFVNDAFVDYGLGNLFFDQMGIIDDYGNQILQTRWEIIQRHTFYDGKYLSTELLTAMLEDYAQPRPMTDLERTIFLEEIFSASDWNPR